MNNNKNMQAPILTDTEAETTVELDDSMVNQVSHGVSITKSIFKLTLNDDLDDKADAEIKSYEARLQDEIKQWGSLWRESIQQLKEFKLKPHPIIDKSILSDGKRAYLEKAPDLQRFLRDSVEFRQNAYIFLEYDYPRFQLVQKNLMEVCDYNAFIIREGKIEENLANKQ